MMEHGQEIALAGPWRFRCDPETLGEHFPQQMDHPWRSDARWTSLSYDDRDWAEIKVPSCWQAKGYDYNGVAWYRKEFANPLVGPISSADWTQDRQLWLRFEGVDYFADVWINDHYLGSHEGYFAAFQYEIILFGHHPSIFVWNCGSQPSVANFEKLGSALAHTARELDPTRIVQQANAIIDYFGATRADPVGDFGWTERSIADFQKRFDWRVDTHQYFGWYYFKPLEALASVPLEYLQLITEYGAQALPSRKMMEKIIPQDALFPPVWPHYTRRCFQRDVQLRFIEHPTSLDQFIKDSQAYQVRFIQHHTEYYRRHKFNPCNGAHLFCFNDCWPAITWSVVDYDREPKEGFFALQRAMAPVQAFLEIADRLKPGEEAKLVLWIVNDLPQPFHDLILAWTITDERSEVILGSGELPCSVEMNSLDQVGSISWTPKASGDSRVVLRLSQDGKVIAENQYRWTV